MSVIRLGSKKPKKKFASIGEQLQRLEKAPLPLRVLGSPKTTAVLGTTLGMLTGGVLGLPTTLLGGAKLTTGVALGEGLIEASPKVESFAKRKLRPEKVGEAIGKEIETFGEEKKEDEDKSILQKVKETAKKAGLIGAGIAGAGALVVGAKKLKKKIEERKLEKEIGLVKKKTLGVLDQPLPAQVGVSSLEAPTIASRAPKITQPRASIGVSDGRTPIRSGYPMTIVQVSV